MVICGEVIFMSVFIKALNSMTNSINSGKPSIFLERSIPTTKQIPKRAQSKDIVCISELTENFRGLVDHLSNRLLSFSFFSKLSQDLAKTSELTRVICSVSKFSVNGRVNPGIIVPRSIPSAAHIFQREERKPERVK